MNLPEANDLTVGIMALVAQQELEAISRRTRVALSVARSRGVKLGNRPNGAAVIPRYDRPAAADDLSVRRQRSLFSAPARARPCICEERLTA